MDIIEKHIYILYNDWKKIKILWNDAKENYQKTNNKDILNELIRQREYVKDNILSEIGKITNSNYVSFGSKNITSDEDLTIFGGNIAQFIYIFHTVFQNTFKYSSSEVYDMNLYGEDFFKKNKNKIFNTPVYNLNDNSVVYCMKTDSNDIVYDQHVWAFVNLLNTLPDKFKIKLDIFLKDNSLYKCAKKKYNILKKFYHKNNISSSNLVYVKILFKLNEMYNSNNVETLKFKRLCKNYLSLSCCFAEDAYITEGAFAHIVLNVQRKFDYKMSKDQYFDSFIENIGKIFKSRKNDCLYNIIDSSKYLFRLRLGLDEFDLNKKNLSIDEIKEIVKYRGKNIKSSDYKINKYLYKIINQEECSIDKYNNYIYKLLVSGIKNFFNLPNIRNS